MKKSLLALLFAIICSSLQAQQEVIFTDRPTTTDAIALISPRTFQVEAGFLSQWDKEEGVEYNWIYTPNISIKYGLMKWLELRVLSSYLTVDTEDAAFNSRVSGFTPLTLSPKFKLIEQNFWIPAVSLATNLTFPGTGKEVFQTDKLNYGFRLLLQHDFGNNYSWSHGFGADWDDSRETTWAYSSVFSKTVSNRIGAFGEVYGYFATDIPSSHHFNTGLTYLASNNLQLDTSIGLPLNENAPNFFVNFGVAWKTKLKE